MLPPPALRGFRRSPLSGVLLTLRELRWLARVGDEMRSPDDRGDSYMSGVRIPAQKKLSRTNLFKKSVWGACKGRVDNLLQSHREESERGEGSWLADDRYA